MPIGDTEAPTQLFKEQRNAVAILRGNLKCPTVPREESLELLQVPLQPMGLHAEEGAEGDLGNPLQWRLRRARGGAAGVRGALRPLLERLEDVRDSQEEEVSEEELELVTYLDLT